LDRPVIVVDVGPFRAPMPSPTEPSARFVVDWELDGPGPPDEQGQPARRITASTLADAKRPKRSTPRPEK
jgi:hypothetical protein